MSLNLSKLPSTSRTRDPIPLPKAGNQPARVLQIISIGAQKRVWKGEEKSPVPQLMIAFELVNSEYTANEEVNRHILRPRPFNLLSDEKATIHKFMKSIDPENTTKGDLSKLINAPSFVSVVHGSYVKDGKDIPVANFNGVSPPIEGFPVRELKGTPIVFDFYAPSYEELEKLPKWIIERIKESVDYPTSKVKPMVEKLESEQGDSAPY